MTHSAAPSSYLLLQMCRRQRAMTVRMVGLRVPQARDCFTGGDCAVCSAKLRNCSPVRRVCAHQLLGALRIASAQGVQQLLVFVVSLLGRVAPAEPGRRSKPGRPDTEWTVDAEADPRRKPLSVSAAWPWTLPALYDDPRAGAVDIDARRDRSHR
jgi:hypothetical protein